MRAIFVVVLLGTGIFANADTKNDIASIPVGVTRFKIAEPKEQDSLSARYVLDSSQKLTGECPKNFKIVNSFCDAELREIRVVGVAAADGRAIPTLTEMSSQELQSVSCSARIVRADEIVRLTLYLNCRESTDLAQK
jgi:hypothetical protein